MAIDTDFPIGLEWAGQIEQDVAASDYVVLLLSARSVHSQMVLEEAAPRKPRTKSPRET